MKVCETRIGLNAVGADIGRGHRLTVPAQG
ncbi:hypothetical protein QFZ94_000610 [Paraburkholderia sp. JPY465]